jgi:hypothetical protein
VFDQILTRNYEFEIIYTATNLLLRASNSLPSVAINVSGGSTQWVCNPFGLHASATDLDGVVTDLTLFHGGSLMASNPGNAINSSFETDFPGPVSFVARATDNRGGVNWTTQQVSLVTLSPEVLALGGFRSNRVFKICMSGIADTNYQMLAIEDLNATNWHVLGSMQFTNGIWRYFDEDASNHVNRFYRAERSQ